MSRLISLLSALALTWVAAAPATAACVGRNLFTEMEPVRLAEIRAETDAVPFASGNFWRATRGDEVITIAGTYHFDDPRHAPNLAALAPHITSAATVLVEAGPDEEKALMAHIAKDPSTMVITEGLPLNQRLPPEVWDPLAKALSNRGIPPFMTAKFQPWYVLTLLSIPPCAMSAMTEKPKGLDGAVIDTALAAGVPVRGLEPFDTLFTIFDAMTPEELTEMLVSTLAIEDMSEDYFTTLVDSYFAGESRQAWELMRFVSYDLPGYSRDRIDADFARMEELVSSSRNRAWIPVLTEASAQGPVFTAFGALHLSGQDGVLNLLQKEGFTLEELPL
ncbi:MAG: TraB/GumN family protein [Tabrizicola sp.]|uniref:TraB/GumN family protein n=1 Tax=Tabrizicola sp. TaxID=2005166 RepID=UPI0027359E48|nr:TraB/GumN family protein [Tabrizicola sp.]MDP3262060.1 TraB/GumN family protein [Tabrizicola sp.]